MISMLASPSEAVAFYQQQLPRHPEALRFLERRGVHDPALIEEFRIGYAPGGICGVISRTRAIPWSRYSATGSFTGRAVIPSTGVLSSPAARIERL